MHNIGLRSHVTCFIDGIEDLWNNKEELKMVD